MPSESWNELFDLQLFWCKVAAVQKVVLLFNLFAACPAKLSASHIQIPSMTVS